MPVPRVRFPELSYANVDDPPLKRGLIRILERAAGRDYFAPLYDQWRRETVPKGQPIIRPMLGLIDVSGRRKFPLIGRSSSSPTIPSASSMASRR
jgi:hypothetical protein